MMVGKRGSRREALETKRLIRYGTDDSCAKTDSSSEGSPDNETENDKIDDNESELTDVNIGEALLAATKKIRRKGLKKRLNNLKVKNGKDCMVKTARCIVATFRNSLFHLVIGAFFLFHFIYSMVEILTHRYHFFVPDEYGIALITAMKFFDAQQSGILPPSNNISWRGNSGLQDGLKDPIHRNLVGGFYDGGDAVKFNFPASFSLTMLSWSVIEYHYKYKILGELDHTMDIIKWGTDYLLKTFDSHSKTINVLVSQVGIKDGCWKRPEDRDSSRPVITCTVCSDLAAEMAAALASSAIALHTKYPKYSKVLIKNAKKLYIFARKHKGISRGSIDAKKFYNSKGYLDELMWSGVWLFYATFNKEYLSNVEVDYQLALSNKGSLISDSDYRALSWNNKFAGAELLLSRVRFFIHLEYPYEETLARAHKRTELTMCSYMPIFSSFKLTKGGLMLLNGKNPKPLQYAANAAFLAALYRDYLTQLEIPGWVCGPLGQIPSYNLSSVSKSQIDYMLGNNPRNRSYLIGIGMRNPIHIHHQGGSIPSNIKNYTCKDGMQWKESHKENPNKVIGALVDGPDRYDRFHDDRINPNYTEPTLAGNSGLVAALVALTDTDSKDCQLDHNGWMHGYAQKPAPSVYTSPPMKWKPMMERP